MQDKYDKFSQLGTYKLVKLLPPQLKLYNFVISEMSRVDIGLAEQLNVSSAVHPVISNVCIWFSWQSK